MKTKVHLYLTILISFSVFSQKTGKVNYGHIESPGKGGPVGLDFNSHLIFDEKQSYYVTAKDSLENENEIENQRIKKVDGEIKQVYVGKHTLEQGKQVYYNRAKDSLWWNKKYDISLYGAEKNTKLNWKIENETKKIGNFNCKKAMTDFRGHTYTAWFTEDIPVSYGPWKLNGLPGLILEAYDTNKEFYVYFKSVEYPVSNLKVPSKLNIPNYDQRNLRWINNLEYKSFLEEKVEKNKTKAIMLAKEYGVQVATGGMKDMSIEIFE